MAKESSYPMRKRIDEIRAIIAAKCAEKPTIKVYKDHLRKREKESALRKLLVDNFDIRVKDDEYDEE